MLALYSIAIAALVTWQRPASAAQRKHPVVAKDNFVRAMDARENRRRARRRGRKTDRGESGADFPGGVERSTEIRRRIAERSTLVRTVQRRLQDYNGYQNGNDEDYDNQEESYHDGGNGYGYNNDNYGDPNNQQQEAQAYQANQRDDDGDGADDYFAAHGDWENEFGFDPTQYSLSYHRCAAVAQFDDAVASQGGTDSIFATKRFAVFRFCPEVTCMGWREKNDNTYCDEEYYGQYYCEYLEEHAEYMKQTEEQADYYGQDWDWNGQGQSYWIQEGSGRTLKEEGEAGEGQEDEGREGQEGEEGRVLEENRRVWQNWWFQQQDQGNKIYYGARGEGCQNNYGEYMIEMEEYLQLMLEWQEERFQTYCQYCEGCMYRTYLEWLENGGGQQRGLSYEEFKASGEHRQLRQLANGHRELGSYYKVCPEYDTCSEYRTICWQDAQDDYSDQGVQYSDYLQCQQVQKWNDGVSAWVGPHCAADGFTITLGIYGDEDCSNYIGDGADITNYIGEDIDYEEDALRSYYNSAHGPLDQLKYVNEDNVCIPCRKGSLMWEQGGNNDDGVEVNEICGSLFEASVHCDKHYRSYNARSKRGRYADAAAQENLACGFIDSVATGNYDEMGYVDQGRGRALDWPSGWMSDSIYAQQFRQYAPRVTPLQVFGLVGSMLACGILTIWALTLRRSLSKTRLRMPACRASAPSRTSRTRQNFGVVMGYSQPNGSYYNIT